MGDKLICTRNNWSKNIRDINLVNGMTGYVKCISYDIPNDEEIKRSAMSIDFQPDFTEETFDKLFLVNDHFEGKNIICFLTSTIFIVNLTLDMQLLATNHKDHSGKRLWSLVKF